MADIACVFHWPPSELKAMPVTELLKWRQLAAAHARALSRGLAGSPKPPRPGGRANGRPRPPSRLPGRA